MSLSSPRRGLRPVAFFAMVLLLACGANSGPESPRGTRVVLITLDTLRYDALMGDGRGESTMPLTRAYAERGLVFKRCYATTSSTQPTHATMLTGLHPWQHGVTQNGHVLTEDHATLAEQLSERGFVTAAVVASYPLWKRMGFSQGFDRYREELERPAEKARYSLARFVTDAAIEEIERAEGDRQFFWFHYFDAHGPYGDTGESEAIRPRRALEQAVADRLPASEMTQMLADFRQGYDEDLLYLDRQLNRLLEVLDSGAAEFETHVVITSDHGESFGEEGSIAHGRRLTPSQIHVPLALVSPGVEPTVRDDVVGSIDLMPTLLSLAALPPSSPGGRDLLAADENSSIAVGMRRTVPEPSEELLVDGRIFVHQDNLFYAVQSDGVLIRGNRERIVDGQSKDLDTRMRETFGRFEDQLDSTETRPLEDQETLEALRFSDTFSDCEEEIRT